MKPAPFHYFDPVTLDEALDLLKEYGEDAKLLAGGQSLGPLLNMRIATPRVIIDINRLDVLNYQSYVGAWLHLGALTRQSYLEDCPFLEQRQPLVAEAIPWIGHRAIRNRGTIGGSLAHADPAAEWLALVTTLEAQLVVRRAGGARLVNSEQFFASYLTTSLEPDELLVEIRIPPWLKNAGWAFVEFSRRHGDFALVGVATVLSLDKAYRVRDARLAMIGVGPTPFRARATEELLKGETPNEKLFQAAAQRASLEIQPDEDIYASANYRRHLTRALVCRALSKATARAREQVAQHGSS